MTGEALSHARQRAGLSQIEAAKRLEVSQTLLSLMETGRRSVTDGVALKAVKAFEASPTNLPLCEHTRHSDAQLAADLAALGYPGFNDPANELRNPAEVLFDTLDRDDLDARVVEALPWLPLRYPDMDWQWLSRQAKLRNRQNRLGFIVTLAARLARASGKREIARALYSVVKELKDARLAKNDTLCQSWWPPVQRRHAHARRSRTASYWNLDTRLTEKDLVHLAA